MKIILHRNFLKKYTRLRKGEKENFKERRNLFLQNPFHPLLRNHPLQGRYQGYRSINITGGLRVVYKFLDETTAVFADIDTHTNLYD